MLYIIQNRQPENAASIQEEICIGSLLLVISSSESLISEDFQLTVEGKAEESTDLIFLISN